MSAARIPWEIKHEIKYSMRKSIMSLSKIDPLERLNSARLSYNYCGICGRTPKSSLEEPNHAPLRWWDADDGWKIGTLCRWCWVDASAAKPEVGDLAYSRTNEVADDVNTDLDPLEALE